MERSRDAAKGPRECSKPSNTRRTQVRVGVPGFANLYAEALELPLERLMADPVRCAETLSSGTLLVDVM